MRDENFYQNVRLPKAISQEYGDFNLLKEQYQSCNYTIDHLMIDFLKKNYPTM